MWNNKGFTLLEVLVAVAVLAIGIVTLLSTHNQSLDLVFTSSRLSKAVLLAKEVMEKAEMESFSELSSDSGTFEEEENSGFSWERSVADTHLDTMKRVDVIISYKSGKGDKTVRLVSYIAERF